MSGSVRAFFNPAIMKFSLRSHPILKVLNENSLDGVMIEPETLLYLQKMGVDINELFKSCSTFFSKKIFFAQEPFVEAYQKAFDKLYDLRIDLLNNVKDINNWPNYELSIINESYLDGTLIWGNSILCYSLGGNYGVIIMFGKIPNGIGLGIRGFIFASGNHTYGFISESTSLFLGLKNEPLRVLAYLSTSVFLPYMFINYASVETKYIARLSKINGIVKYINNTPLDITILNCKWFTTIVRDKEFAVRGHFRLQPKKKNGEWTKELIWISDFMKKGYTSYAKLPNQND
jgi:hypothetical protein